MNPLSLLVVALFALCIELSVTSSLSLRWGVTVGAAQLPEELAANRCEEQGDGVACWRPLASHNGCYFWAGLYERDTRPTWTGECSDGLAQGLGTLEWMAEPLSTSERPARWRRHRGSLRDGKKHGHWVDESFDGHVAWDEGPYVEGKRHGEWSLNYGGMLILEGPYENDQRHGHWVIRETQLGLVEEGTYLFGQRQGRWTFRDRDGDEEEGLYVDDERHGRWIMRYHDGRVEETSYVDGERHGRWVMRYPDGSVEEGSYVAGNKDSDRYKVFNFIGVAVCNSIPRETHPGPARVRPSVPWSP